MGGYSGSAKVKLGLIALIALRRAKAEQARRGGKLVEAPAPAAAAKTKRGWFG